MKIDPESPAADRMPVYAILDNIRSVWNVGSMFRTADSVALGGPCSLKTERYIDNCRVLEASEWMSHPNEDAAYPYRSIHDSRLPSGGVGSVS